MALERWYRAPRQLALLFLAVTLVPGAALVWLTMELVEKDRSLEKQRAQERVERVAEKIVAASHQRLSDLESQLHLLAMAGDKLPPAHTVLVIADGETLTSVPSGALVYHPILPWSREPPPAVFAEAERYEYQQRDPGRAVELFESLARSEDSSIRAGALLRLGRTRAKAQRVDAALVAFTELATLGSVPVEGLPAGMLGLAARCGLLEKAGRQAELAASARDLRTRLVAGSWVLLRSTYDFYMDEARRWTGELEETERERNARALAAAVQTLHQEWLTGANGPGRASLIAEGRPVVLASARSQGRLAVLAGGPDFLRDAWKDHSDVQVLLTDGAGHSILGQVRDGTGPQAVLTTDASGFPWTLRVATTSQSAYTGVAAGQRRLQMVGLALVLLMLAGSAYFALRGVTRELAVARLQSDFVAAVSHEFRTPLASLRHLSDMLSQGRVADAAQRQHCYDFLSRESERLERLVEELLDFGRVEAGAYRYRFEQVDAVDLVRELVTEFQEKIGPNNYRVELSVELDRAPMLADRPALARAIWNLLDNAVKYSPGSDTIWVALARDGDSAVIRVRDRGLGIAVSEQKAIFQKFVRGSNTRTEQIKGTGIGLAMVQHIVKAHHGEVRVESQPDQGSTFALWLPTVRPT